MQLNTSTGYLPAHFMKGKSKKAGPGSPTVLIAAEEPAVALTCLTLADMEVSFGD